MSTRWVDPLRGKPGLFPNSQRGRKSSGNNRFRINQETIGRYFAEPQHISGVKAGYGPNWLSAFENLEHFSVKNVPEDQCCKGDTEADVSANAEG